MDAEFYHTTQSNLQVQYNPYQIPNGVFSQNRKNKPKLCMKTQKPLNSQNSLEKKWSWSNQASYSDNTATVIRTVWFWHKNRHRYQWNKKQSPEINPHTCGQLICYTEGRNMQQRKGSLFNKWFWVNWTATCRSMKLEHFSNTIYKNESKMDERPKVKTDSIRLFEENQAETP